jgi:uncharacterized protein (DUF58 family)
MRASAAPAAPFGRLRLSCEGLAWFAAAAVLGLLGWAKSLNLLLLLTYVMVALLVINGVLARLHAGRIRVRREPPAPLFAGETGAVQLIASNPGTRSGNVLIESGETRWPLERLAPGEEIARSVPVRWSERGRHRLPPLVAASTFPFGFLRFDRPEPADDAAIVLPELGEADAEGLRRWVLRRAGFEGRSRKVLRRVTTDLADLRGVRPYRPGDSLRSIHWRSSARRRELMVREYDAAPSPELYLVVEPWLPESATAADRAQLEAALSLAATIVHAWSQSIATRITVLMPGEEARSAGGGSIRELLAPLGETAGGSSFPSLEPRQFGRSVLRAARVLVSSRANSPLHRDLAQIIGKPFVAIDPSQRLPWYEPPRRPA